MAVGARVCPSVLPPGSPSGSQEPLGRSKHSLASLPAENRNFREASLPDSWERAWLRGEVAGVGGRSGSPSGPRNLILWTVRQMTTAGLTWGRPAGLGELVGAAAGGHLSLAAGDNDPRAS